MKSFAVIGLGRFGETVAAKLFDLGHEVLAVDRNHEKINEIADSVTRAVCANPMEPGIISELALADFDTVVVGIGNNLSDSILITMMLKEQGAGYVIAKAQDENHKRVLEKVGADRVVIPERDEGLKLASQLVSENVFDVIDISSKYSIADVKIPKSWYGKTLMQINLRKVYGVNVIAVKDSESGKITTISPVPDHVFGTRDVIIVIGENKNIRMLNTLK